MNSTQHQVKHMIDLKSFVQLEKTLNIYINNNNIYSKEGKLIDLLIRY